MVDNVFMIPSWIVYTAVYFVIGIFWATASVNYDWEIEYREGYIPLWPFYIFFWLPMVIIFGTLLIGYGLFVITIRDTIAPWFRRNYSQYKYRRRVRKFKPKYGYDK